MLTVYYKIQACLIIPIPYQIQEVHMSALIINEQIKASEVELIGLNGESLGIVAKTEALTLAKQNKVDLVCLNIMQSPPLCQLISKGSAKQQRNQQKAEEQHQKKMKEIRLTPQIEEHDLITKTDQAGKLLKSGHPVLLVVKVQGKEAQAAKQLLETIIHELEAIGKPQSKIQTSGKQVAVTILPVS